MRLTPFYTAVEKARDTAQKSLTPGTSGSSCGSPAPYRNISRDLKGGQTGSGAIMAAEDTDVDIEGDVVLAAAAQPG